MDKRELGNEGEMMARDYLMQQGYTIVDTNWQFGHLEIDIIAIRENILAFVEVKTRSSSAVSEPQMAVNQQKQKNIIRAANAYILKNKYNCEARFDIISVIRNEKGTQIEHLPDAYGPRW